MVLLTNLKHEDNMKIKLQIGTFLSIIIFTLSSCATKMEQIAPGMYIIEKPIKFQKERMQMTKKYIKDHYGLSVSNIEITPKIVLLHWTSIMDFDETFDILNPQKLISARKDIQKASALNVSAQFIVDRDGKIYRLMPENWMARHVIGLNYSSIGIENIGGRDDIHEDLTPAQVKSNVALIRYLKKKYPTIEYVIGHFEYRRMESHPLWLELDPNYRTDKNDPGPKFMREVRAEIIDLKLKEPPVQK